MRKTPVRTLSPTYQTENVSWPLLLKLWRELLAQTQMPVLDRWLKQQFGQLKPVALKQQLAVSRALMDATSFMQLACALEHGYQQQTLELDWETWDQHWHFDQVKKIPVTVLWFWLAQRCNLDTTELRLKDINARKLFFTEANNLVSPALVNVSETVNASGAIKPSGVVKPLQLIWYGMRPQWQSLLAERAAISQWSDEQFHFFMQQQTQMPPLWLRPRQQSSGDSLATILREEGVNTGVTPEGYLYATGGKGINNTLAYQQGLVEIQDLASQQIANAVAVKPGQKVWDCCAGAGGKTLAIAARTANKGMVLATDLHAFKLDELKRRAKRANLFNIRCFTWDGASALQLPKEVAQQQGFDWVLVDAPCSSAGTWRRNPDARWRFNPVDTHELVDLQRQILHQAALAVRPGGHLVYATCSWQTSENEAQIEWFLQQNPQFNVVYQRLLGCPEADADTMFVGVLSAGAR